VSFLLIVTCVESLCIHIEFVFTLKKWSIFYTKITCVFWEFNLLKFVFRDFSYYLRNIFIKILNFICFKITYIIYLKKGVAIYVLFSNLFTCYTSLLTFYKYNLNIFYQNIFSYEIKISFLICL